MVLDCPWWSLVVMAGTMTVGELIMINALLLQLMQPLDHLGANYMQLNQGLVGVVVVVGR
jgi:ABC-type transport system involved in Fe-S cluster assembly fused permease/ATPase subunit